MKKQLLLITGLLAVLSANAAQNTFKNHKGRIEQRQNKLVHTPYQKFLSTSVNVPTLTKFSGWDINNNVWTPNTATKHEYQNDLLAVTYELSYDMNDTFSRALYTYNADKKISTILNENLIQPGVFVPNLKYTYTYSNNNLREVVLGEQYDFQSQSWNPFSRFVYEYDSRGINTRYTYEMYSNDQWQMIYGYSTLITYLNNNSNKCLERVDSFYHSGNQIFVPEYKEIREYNANEEIVHVTYYENEDGTLFLRTRDSITYVAGLPTTLIEYEFDENTNAFYKDYKLEDVVWNNFNPNTDFFDNDPLNYTQSLWDGQAWNYSYRYSSTILDNYGSTTDLEEIYINSAWVPFSRSTEKFDDKFNNIEYTDEYYDDQNSIWTIQYSVKNLFQYDLSNNATEKIVAYYSTTNNNYVNNSKYEYFDYISIAAGFNSYKNSIETKLFPNPSSDGSVSVNVKMVEDASLNIKVLDLKGSVVCSYTENLGAGLNTIQLSNLKQGMYIVELKTDFGLSRTKLIVK